MTYYYKRANPQSCQGCWTGIREIWCERCKELGILTEQELEESGDLETPTKNVYMGVGSIRSDTWMAELTE